MDKTSKVQYVVVFIFLSPAGKVLVEKRGPKSFLSGHLLFPGGKIEDHDLNNLEKALKREVYEELGVKLIKYTLLPTNEDIAGIGKDVILKPFVINKWKGEIGEKVLDIGNPLFWLEIDEMLNSPLEPTRNIAQCIKEYLGKNDSSKT